jgi:ABC-type glycerol-3-phosphate transport system substrate-binding protein
MHEVPQEIPRPLRPVEEAVAPQHEEALVQGVPTPTHEAQVVQSTPVIKSPPPANGGETLGDNGGFHFSSLLRFIVIGALVVILLVIVWAVGSFIFSSKNTGNQKVTLTYWGLWEDKSVMGPILADFQKQHPNITVVYSKEDPKDYVRRLLTRTQEGNGPDIFRFNNTWVYPLQSMLLPLPSSVIDKNQLDKNFPPVMSSDMISNGAVYGLPMQMDTLSLFVNSDIFTHAGAAVPTTWENFITVAKALTVKDPSGRIQTAGASLGTYENVTHSADIVSLLLLQNGANLQKLDGSANAKDALTFYTSFAKPDGNVWDSTLDNSLASFSKGKVAMYFGYSYDIFAIKAANPTLNFAVYPVPHLPGRDMTVASYWVEGVSNKSKHPKESLELLQYLAQKDTLTKLYTEESKQRLFGELYAQTNLADGLTSNSLLAPFISQYKGALSSIFVGDTYYDEYNGALNRYLGNAVNSVLKNTSPESALTTLSQGVSQVTSQFTPSSR